jgi:hypothetical protein
MAIELLISALVMIASAVYFGWSVTELLDQWIEEDNDRW